VSNPNHFQLILYAEGEVSKGNTEEQEEEKQ